MQGWEREGVWTGRGTMPYDRTYSLKDQGRRVLKSTRWRSLRAD